MRHSTGILLLALAVQASGQGPNVPMDSASLRAGGALYAKWCAACHGPNAKGAEGPDLFRSRVLQAASGKAAHDLIVNGRPGTEMRPFPLKPDETYALIGYLHGLTRPGMAPPAEGDVEAGRRLFANRGCEQCHMLAGKGGVLGPDLSGVALRLFPDQIRRAVAEPDAEIAAGFGGVTVTLNSGERITGALRNEDNFSLQVIKPGGDYLLVLRDRTAKVEDRKTSLMPAARLTSEELRDLVAFLHRQRQRILKYTSGFQNY